LIDNYNLFGDILEMAIFGNNLKQKRVYLRRSSLKLQTYAIVGTLASIVTLAIFQTHQ